MKKTLFLLLLSGCSLKAFCQSSVSIDETKTTTSGADDTLRKSNKIFSAIQDLPAFPGGREGYKDYIKKNLTWPADALNKEGIVILNFIVEKDGVLNDIKVTRSLSPSQDAEAIRIIKASPKWTPARIHKIPVRVMFQIPVPYKKNL